MLFRTVTRLRFAIVSQLVTGPKQTAREQIKVDVAFHSLIRMAKGRPEYAAFPVSIDPDRWVPVRFLLRGQAFCQRNAIRPHFLDFVQLIRIILPLRRESFHYRML